MTPQLDRHSETDQNPEMLSAIYAENRIAVIKEMYAALGKHTCSEKMTF